MGPKALSMTSLRAYRNPARLVIPQSLAEAEIYKWWSNPPPRRIERQDGAVVDLAANASRTEITYLDIPDGSLGVWWLWAQSIGLVSDLRNVTWHLTINGTPKEGFYSLLAPDFFGTLTDPMWCGWIVPGGSRLAVLASNGTASIISSVGAYIRAYWILEG